jgi:nitrous oxidase accessory protein NosD
MNTRNIFGKFSIVSAASICLLGGALAQGQANRTWVSPSGDDSNNCAAAKPCRTFAGALTKTNSAGEIVVQESGAFGRVTIDKSITIDGGGKYAGIQTSGSAERAITIQAGSSDVVVLRGLTLKGIGLGAHGIYAAASIGALHVENCAISNFGGGIEPHGTPAVFIQETTIRECGQGVSMIWSGGKALIEHSRLENNGTGLYLLQGPQVTVRDTVASGNTYSGFQVDWGYLNIENCAVANNATGIYSTTVPSPNGPSTVVVSNSVVTNNQYGFRQSGTSTFFSRVNNTLSGNGTDVSGTITPLAGT